MARSRRAAWTACLTLVALAGCDERVDVGSNVLWTALFEDGTVGEWTGTPGGAAIAAPAPPNTITVSTTYAHHGHYGAELTIDAGPDGVQENAGLVRKGDLPVEAYYSAWYYIPTTVTVGAFWLIFKFRLRTDVTDTTTENELYDFDIVNTASGQLTVSIFDHQTSAALPLEVTSPIIPVSVWFQVEAFYRNTNDASGQVIFWLDGQEIARLDGPMAPTPWVEWDVVNVGEVLTPNAVTVAVDDCAVSLSRVGPTGLLAE
ncbi:MAG TPA: hypothetical protein VHG72_16685 [Polyangia bacterium]|nr:hypothetical protein [Polyangia bacterium]